MHTLSLASRTCMASASAVEWTATVLMPISRQARWIRSAISPRLAMRTFSNMLFDDHQRLAIFHRLTIAHQNASDLAGARGANGIERLHRLDQQHRLPLLHAIAQLDESRCPGFRCQVDDADHRRGHRTRVTGKI